jgi:stage III sporulation protein SpoIIIAA
MPVGVVGKQHEIMREAVENQSPDVVIVDEISTLLEVQAARTIAQRGVMLIATVHGITLPELMHCRVE